ncbi:hypothetical protein BLNAU_4259 [Blattamonas nauphoetae]|uniref:Uncharacterized protein n=1 Tax=Blattamonas nauphoetae TaxID=2049346 RepID=A0ABQ9YAW5_9EUKA|nr:hypothetical protein BLNAU_4259 [Blattamonas nauphoetae]
MIGSCVSWSTNHLCGTGICDVNLGGSVLCSNTSFTHCTTTTTEYSNQHHTTRTSLTTADTLHLFYLCTFKTCSSSHGGAICLSQISADLEIQSCSFESCTSTNVGGALYFQQLTMQSSITVSSSSFLKCSSNGNSGGSLCLSWMESLSISDCVFLDSQTTVYGGAVYIYKWDVGISNTALSNCLFEDCATSVSGSSGGGGALYFQSCSSIRLDSLRFRECVSTSGNGHDLYFNSQLPTVSLTTVSNSDSTSTPKENRIYPTTIAVGDVLPTPTETTTLLSQKAQQTTSTTAEIVVTLDRTVTGLLLVLVSNSEGTGRTDTTKAPNIGRVLVFSIESSSIGVCTVSTGETGLLQVPLSDNKVVAASLSKHTVSFSDMSLEIIILHPTFTSAECVLDDSCTRAILNLEGFDVDGETFVLTLQNNWTLEATFAENKARTNFGVIGESSKWMENEMFVITSGTKKDDDSIVVSISSPLYFTIPLAARLMNIVVSDLNEVTNEVTLSFSSRHLKPDHDYTITLERKDGKERVVMELRTNSSGLLSDQIVKLCPSNGNEEEFKNSLGFGEEYEVTRFSAKTGDVDYPIQFSRILVSMPIEPVRITLASCKKEDADKTVVSVEGSGLIENETYTLTLSGTPTDQLLLDIHETSISVLASSSTEAKSVPLLLSSTTESSLLFGHRYKITGITNGSVAGMVVGTPSFTTHSEPALTSLSCKLKEGDAKTAEIWLLGTNIPDGLYNLVLKGKGKSGEIEQPIKIVESAGRLEIAVFSSSLLEYGGKYEVVSLSMSSLTVALPTSATYRLLQVPDAPARVRSASCVVAGEKKTRVEVVICGEILPVKGTLSVKVNAVGSSGSTSGSEIGLPDTTIGSEENPTIEIEVYDVSNPCLEYGKTYELTSLTFSETTSWILDESVRFSVPCEPVRVTAASCTKEDADEIVVSVEGSGFVSEEFYSHCHISPRFRNNNPHI